MRQLDITRYILSSMISVLCFLTPWQAVLAVETTLETATDVTEISGEAAQDAAGYAVAAAGDVNGDGFDDIIVGSYLNDDAATDAGSAYLIYGQAEPLTTDNLSQAVEFTGEAAEDHAGYSVASAGDLNNDGFDDILIGAPGNDDGGTDSGAVYIIYGQAAALNSISLSDAIEFTGAVPADSAGYSIAGAGDINGDGFDDILIGAPGSDAAGQEAGVVYVVYGAATELVADSVDTAVELTGEAAGDEAGSTVDGAGDVDSDGLDDIVVGAPGSDDGGTDSGAAYIVYGQTDDLSSESLETATELTGEAAGDEAGTAVAAAGDMNDDGFDDVVIGAPLNDDGGTNAGAAYVVYGETDELSGGSLSDAGELTGEAAGDQAGDAVAGIGDVNDDGFDDIAVGADQNDDGGENAGAVYEEYGQEEEIVDEELSHDIEFVGEENDANTGESIAGGGDINGDGTEEVVIGAPGNDEEAVDTGAVYVVSPDATPTALTTVTKQKNRLQLVYDTGATQTLRPFGGSNTFRHVLSSDRERLIVYNGRRVKIFQSGERLDHMTIWKRRAKSRRHFTVAAKKFFSNKPADTIAFAAVRNHKSRIGTLRLTKHNTFTKKRIKAQPIPRTLPMVLTTKKTRRLVIVTFGRGSEQTVTRWRVRKNGNLKRQ